MHLDDTEFLSTVKLNILFLDDNINTKVCKHIENRANVQNMLTLFQFSNCFNLKNFADVAFKYIERCFTMLVDSDNFLELDYNVVSKLLASSKLDITSELEVLTASFAWIRYQFKTRRKFAKDILLKVRLPSISYDALEFTLDKNISLYETEKCLTMLSEVLDSTQHMIRNNSGVKYTTRHCEQNRYNTLICGGFNSALFEFVEDSVNQLKGTNLNSVEYLSSMRTSRKFFEAVYLKGGVYVFGGMDNHKSQIMNIERYSLATNSWNIVAEMYDKRTDFCVCAFANKIFVIGGEFWNHPYWNPISSCMQFDTKTYKWKEVARMSDVRAKAACAVFKERLVVCGGRGARSHKLNAVESYDVITDTWKPMANLILERSCHSLLVVRDKLFVIGSATDTCEVFDNVAKKFVAFNSPSITSVHSNNVVSIANKIYAFQDNIPLVLCYDVDKHEWSELPCEVTKNLSDFSCVKVPWF